MIRYSSIKILVGVVGIEPTGGLSSYLLQEPCGCGNRTHSRASVHTGIEPATSLTPINYLKEHYSRNRF